MNHFGAGIRYRYPYRTNKRSCIPFSSFKVDKCTEQLSENKATKDAVRCCPGPRMVVSTVHEFGGLESTSHRAIARQRSNKKLRTFVSHHYLHQNQHDTTPPFFSSQPQVPPGRFRFSDERVCSITSFTAVRDLECHTLIVMEQRMFLFLATLLLRPGTSFPDTPFF